MEDGEFLTERKEEGGEQGGQKRRKWRGRESQAIHSLGFRILTRPGQRNIRDLVAPSQAVFLDQDLHLLSTAVFIKQVGAYTLLR